MLHLWWNLARWYYWLQIELMITIYLFIFCRGSAGQAVKCLWLFQALGEASRFSKTGKAVGAFRFLPPLGAEGFKQWRPGQREGNQPGRSLVSQQAANDWRPLWSVAGNFVWNAKNKGKYSKRKIQGMGICRFLFHRLCRITVQADPRRNDGRAAWLPGLRRTAFPGYFHYRQRTWSA